MHGCTALVASREPFGVVVANRSFSQSDYRAQLTTVKVGCQTTLVHSYSPIEHFVPHEYASFAIKTETKLAA
jgi:hypothetical protein